MDRAHGVRHRSLLIISRRFFLDYKIKLHIFPFSEVVVLELINWTPCLDKDVMWSALHPLDTKLWVRVVKTVKSSYWRDFVKHSHSKVHMTLTVCKPFVPWFMIHDIYSNLSQVLACYRLDNNKTEKWKLEASHSGHNLLIVVLLFWKPMKSLWACLSKSTVHPKMIICILFNLAF